MSTPAAVSGLSTSSTRRWLDIDWAMKAVSLAMHLVAGLDMEDASKALEAVHSVLRERRDKA